MQRLWLSSILLAAVFANAADSGIARFNQAIELEKQGSFSEAYHIFDAVSISAPEYQFAFSEMQKIHYRRGEWDKFFGFASFYRRQLVSKFAAPELLLLETLALSRHCQFEAAEKTLGLARSMSLGNKNALEQVEAVSDLAFLQSKMPGNVTSKETRSRVRAFSSTTEWKGPVTSEGREVLVRQAIKNPRALRVYVPNICVSLTGRRSG